MHTNGNNIEHIEFITFIKAARQRSSTAAQLRHENAELIRIIADFDARLATVEAERDMIADTCKRTHELCVKWQEETRKVATERDELQRKLNGYNHTAKMCGIHSMSITKRVVI